ncbi:hypothetical protein EQW76_00970 [Rhizobium sp. rho-13.1]|uniref:hypothetical protein n=1 Tax=Rhizobium sp. rho-13.1 TaxID=2506431 RepID=UPI00115D8407|nr:hypothetical protein [Rhizobium sp. rho-13.1]TQX91338.1 hypothetical protein EQW76_00970 [Rhizobium sp. rho-13.1]
MEDVRANEFPDRPSRLTSSYFFDAIGEARFYRGTDLMRSAMLLYEVELIKPQSVQHSTDWRNNVHDGSLTLDWARRYWRGEHLPPDGSGHVCREILAETPLKIISKLAF